MKAAERICSLRDPWLSGARGWEPSPRRKFSPADMMMAARIDRARVEMQVAMAFAVSWKPLMKSKASAAKTTSPRRTSGDSAIFQRNPFEDVGGVFATVGGGLERLVDLLPLENVDRVLLVGEEFGDRIAAHPVRLVLQGVHLHAVLEYLAHLRGQVLDPAGRLPGRFHDEKPKLLGLGSGFGHLVEVDPIGGPGGRGGD